MGMKKKYSTGLLNAVVRIWNSGFYNDITTDSLCRMPRRAISFCDTVRYEMFDTDVPGGEWIPQDDEGDSLILGALLHARKTGSQLVNRDAIPNPFGTTKNKKPKAKQKPKPKTLNEENTEKELRGESESNSTNA